MGTIDDATKPKSNTSRQVSLKEKRIFIGLAAIAALADATLLGGLGCTNYKIHKQEKTSGKESAYYLAKELKKDAGNNLILCGIALASNIYINAYDVIYSTNSKK